MKCIAVSVSEVMAWVDAFCASTGLAPSKAAMLYAELSLTNDFDSLVAQVLVRSFSMAELDDVNYSIEVNQIISEAYENVLDDQKNLIREHFYRVMQHHGFKGGAIATLFECLNPLSLYEARCVTINQAFIFDNEFVETSFFDKYMNEAN